MRYTVVFEAWNDFCKSNKIKNKNHFNAKVWIVREYIHRRNKRRHKKQNK